MSGPGFKFDFTPGEFVRAFDDQVAKIASAATAAVADAGEIAQKAGRASIAGGGFSSRWTNALRLKMYGVNSPQPAAFLYHKISYAGVFETGMTITGKPLMWLPLPNVPLGNGGRQLKPSEYIDRIGPLTFVNVPGKPLLVGRASSAGIARATERAVRFRKKALRAGAVFGQPVPLFVGVSSVTDPSKFDVTGAIKQAGEKLGELFVKHLEDGHG
jgi:hypothetical protein